jgi:DNA invertase Pin-like site-specific DNA recombinase
MLSAKIFTAQQASDIAVMYQQGTSISSLAMLYQCSPKPIKRVLKRAGVKLRPLSAAYGNEAEIVNSYIAGESMLSLYKRFRVCSQTIRQIIMNSGTPQRTLSESSGARKIAQKATEQQKGQIIALYEQGNSTEEVGRIVGLPNHIIQNRLRGWGIPRRIRKYALKEDLFDKIDSEEKAYFLGFLYADGCNMPVKGSYSITLTLQGRDVAILEKLRDLVCPGLPVRIKKATTTIINGSRAVGTEQRTLNFNSKKLSLRLNELGCTQAKSFTLTFPDWLSEDTLSHFIRGYIDGDGWLVVTKPATYIVGAVGSDKFIEQMAEVITEHCGVNVVLNGQGRTEGISRLHIGGVNQCATVAAWLYKDATIYLERKRRKAEQMLVPFCLEPKQRGEGSYLSILSESKVLEIKNLLLNSGLTYKQIAALFKVGKSTIVNICYGNSWSHLTGWGTNHNPTTIRTDKQHIADKLTKEIALEIVSLTNSEASPKEIALKLNVSQENVSRVIRGERWGKVTGIYHKAQEPTTSGKPRYNASNRAKLTQSQAEEIKALLAQDLKYPPIAERFGVSVSTISLIKRGKLWQ